VHEHDADVRMPERIADGAAQVRRDHVAAVGHERRRDVAGGGRLQLRVGLRREARCEQARRAAQL
jgi:hypothetical protein